MLSQRIMMLFVLIAAGPPIVLGLVLFYMVKMQTAETSGQVREDLEQIQIEQVFRQNGAVVERLAARLDERVASWQSMLQMAGSLPGFQTMDGEMMRAHAEALLATNPVIQWVMISDSRGETLLSSDVEGSVRKAPAPGLMHTQIEAALRGLSGAATLPLNDKSITLILFLPIGLHGHDVRGVLLVGFDVEAVQPSILQAANPQERQRLSIVTGGGVTLRIDAEGKLIPVAQGSTDLPGMREPSLRGALRRGDLLISFAHTRRLDWQVQSVESVAVALDPVQETSHELEQSFNRSLYDMRQYSLAIIVFFLIVAVVAARLMARDIVKPIDEIVDGVTHIANGYLEQRVPVHREDELGFLAGAVNRLASQLQSSQEELLHSRDRSDHIMRSVTDCLLMVDNHGTITACNPAAQETLGYNLGELIRQPLTRIFDSAPDQPSISERIESGMDIDGVEAMMITSYGGRLPVLVSTTTLRDQMHAPVGAMVVARDITDQLQIEEDRRRLAAIVQGSNDLIVTLGTGGQILFLNAAGRQMLGIRDVSELLGKSFGDFCSPPDAARLAAQILPETMSHGHHESELQLVTLKEEKQFPAHVNFTLIEDPKTGEPALISGIGRDVTERKRVLVQLRHYAAELEASNRELEQFAFVASHDLREPLRKLHNLSQLLERRCKDQLDDKGMQIVSFISASATRMLSLIKDLLEYSRVGNRNDPFETTACNQLVAEMLENLSLIIKDKQAVITCDELPTLCGDPHQLAMLFQNLICNALKFHGEAPPRVHIGVERDGANWRFCVRDNGIGIDPAHHQKIFVIFQRLQPADRYEGTGIGLAICKKIVERHGGSIWVESVPGEGAAFYFTLPVDPKPQGIPSA